MPTVLRSGGYRFFFFSNEGKEAPHIHVASGGSYAKFWLDPVEVADVRGYDAVEMRRLRRIVMENVFVFRKGWNDFFAGA